MKQEKHYEPSHYINRELSWLEFNDRVLEEAQDRKNPLLERVKFMAIVSSNLDEFFMIRVASLKDQVHAGFTKPDAAGLPPTEQLRKIATRSHRMVHEQYNTFNHSLLPSMAKENIHLIGAEGVTHAHRDYLDQYFQNTLFPVLTPMAVDNSRPFPLIYNKSLNIAVLLEGKGENEESIFATVQVPAVLERLVELPAGNDKRVYIFLEEVIRMYMEELFRGHRILAMHTYRITRNADLGYDEEGAEDLLEVIEQTIRRRRWGAVIRLEVDSEMDERLLRILQNELEVTEDEIYRIQGPLDLTFLMRLSDMDDYDHLRNEPLNPLPAAALMDQEDLFEAIKKEDVLLHHPFETFDPIVAFVKKAAQDPYVLAIKQTLYRVSGNSPIVQALTEAAENGKQVTALVELKARFDEENNISWARRLEQAGCHVIYGLVGLKTHCKLTLIVRKEEDGIVRYVHMGTGNYNDITARFYTDLGLFTVNPYIGADASSIFNMLSGYSQLAKLYKLEIAPIGLRTRFLQLIQNEAEHAREGRPAKIIAKMNSLVDEEIIQQLYEASKAGVQIHLIVRGICCLRPGVPGISENIRVISIVDRFLEHSRIFYFYNDGKESTFLSSADWMPRNLDRRVELFFPIESASLKREVRTILEVCLKDTVKARVLNEDGSYRRIEKRGKKLLQSQLFFYEMTQRRIAKRLQPAGLEEFQPRSSWES